MYYNIDSPMGQTIMDQAQQAIVAYCESRGISGEVNLREIRPEDFGQTAQTITIAAGETSYTLTRDIKEGCGIVVCGFTVNDQVMREVDLHKGESRLANWNLGNVYHMRDKEGVRKNFVVWARGDTFKLVFHAKAASTVDQVSETWPIGWALGPHMFSAATRASG